MNSREAAQQLIEELEHEFGEEADTQIGDLITALANLRAERAQTLAGLREQFFAEKQAEFEQYVAKAKEAAVKEQVESLARLNTR